MTSRLADTYDRFALERPATLLALLLLLLGLTGSQVVYFRLDASADALLLEDDPDLQKFRQVSARYDSQELLIVTFTPAGDVFADSPLANLKRLRDELRAVDGVDSVMSILDVPLVKSADISPLQLTKQVPTLEDPNIDRKRARLELTESPVFSNLIISADQQTTALLMNLESSENFQRLQLARNELLMQKRAGVLDTASRDRLEIIAAAYGVEQEFITAQRHELIATVRAVIDRHRLSGAIHLGGVAMIADDMVTFVRSDLIVFGTGVLCFVIIVLTVIFGQPRWIALPLLCCIYASVTMIGILGMVGWEVTVISSNFLALMLIITISISIHLAVRYRQLLHDHPDLDQLSLVSQTVRRVVAPSLYASLTTMIGFSSLVFSDIKPVIDFGWMMSMGIAVAFTTSFTLLPAVLVMLPKPATGGWAGRDFHVTTWLATFTRTRGTAILTTAGLLAVVSAFGISKLTVENSFIDYFGRDTEIYQGMKLIDEKLGGTTPLDVLLYLGGPDDDEPYTDEAFDDDDFDDTETGIDDEAAYWFTASKVERIKRVHDYLDEIPEVGKVLSLASVIRVAEELNDGQPFDSLELSVLYKRLPDELRTPLLDPYFSYEHDEARIMLRIIDSRENLRRAELLERIRDGLQNDLQLGEDEVALSGTLLLYNNMLQSLFSSQIASLGAVIGGIGLMLLVLFRSPVLAVIGIVPNMLAAAIVLGLMGIVGIPLDMMTITIAAITIGIAVDNGIHYIYRFREEFALSGDYDDTLQICHSNIGRAVLYTSTTVIFGFSILATSNFLPTIYFGVLTGLAMLIALLSALTLLPRLILLWKPFPAPASE